MPAIVFLFSSFHRRFALMQADGNEVKYLVYLKGILKNEKGSALTMVLVLAIVFAVLGISLFNILSSHHHNLVQNELKNQSYYAAESGVNYAIQKWKNEKTTFSTITKEMPEISGVQLNYATSFIQNPDLTYTITSVGTAKKSDSLSQSTTLSVILTRGGLPTELQGVEMMNYTIFSGTQGGTGYGSHDMFLGQETNGVGNRGIALRNDIDVYGDLYAHRFYIYTQDQTRVKFHQTRLVTYPQNQRKVFDLDESKSNGKDSELSDADLLRLYGGDVKVVSVDKNLKFADEFADVTKALLDSGKMHRVQQDLHITKANESDMENLIRLNDGWLDLRGYDLVIDEGVELNVDDFIVIAKGILIGAKPFGRTADEPVKVLGNHIVMVAEGSLSESRKSISPIQYENSYRADYLDNGRTKWSDLSILLNRKAEIDGWVIGKGDVIFDYKQADATSVNPYTVKIKGGVSGYNGLFPRKIQLGSDELYFEDWDVE